jgi:hypothetical protein
MKRRNAVLVIAAAILLGATVQSPAQNVGGGLSFWVPESLYLDRGGSVGVESALGSSVGLGARLSLPFGVAYNKVYGLLAEFNDGGTSEAPWFISDSLLGFVMAKARVPIGPLYIDVFGGGAGVWNVALVPLVHNIEASIAGTGELVSFSGAPAVSGGAFGWGWQAGGGIGATIPTPAGALSVDLNATYRVLRSNATVSGTYYAVDTAGLSASGPADYGPTAIAIRFAGISVGIDVSVQM